MNAHRARFDAREKSLPVPASLLGSLLAEIDDVAELKCALRAAGLAAQTSGAPKRVPASRLETDSALLAALGSPEEIRRGVGLAVERGVLLEASGWLLLRTPQNEQAAEELGLAPEYYGEGRAERLNVYELYEQNIGMLTPLIAEETAGRGERVPCGVGGIGYQRGGGRQRAVVAIHFRDTGTMEEQRQGSQAPWRAWATS